MKLMEKKKKEKMPEMDVQAKEGALKGLLSEVEGSMKDKLAGLKKAPGDTDGKKAKALLTDAKNEINEQESGTELDKDQEEAYPQEDLEESAESEYAHCSEEELDGKLQELLKAKAKLSAQKA